MPTHLHAEQRELFVTYAECNVNINVSLDDLQALLNIDTFIVVKLLDDEICIKY